uniref:HD domain-containing protein n=1 Tax=Aeromonas finlandensis TaxID=1543375 RepID=UPI0012E05BA7
MPSKWYENNDLIIRDSVHGDIYISSSIIDVINSDEFQRLRRIKQLSVANMIFPSADHTRFSHSIGTYHVMRKIISHVEKQLSNINIDICERDKNLVLVAALLHDIGHG